VSPSPVPQGAFQSAGLFDLVSPTFGVSVIQRCHSRYYYLTCRDEVVSTDDFGVTWKVLVPASTPSLTDSLPRITQVYFLDPQHGWVVTHDCGKAKGALARTQDGGRTWRWLTNATLSVSCHAETGVWVDFINALSGWRTHLEPAGSFADLFTTSDAGATWRKVTSSRANGATLPILGVPRFVDASHGWLASEWGTSLMSLFRTSDGGASWQQVPIIRPACCQFRLTVGPTPPAFFGSSGVFFTNLVDHGGKVIGFYSSGDGGQTWGTPLVVTPTSAEVPPSGFRNSWPAVSVVSPSVWWIADTPHGTIQITTDAGKSWQTRSAPAVGAAGSFTALDANRAWLVVTDAHGIGPLYTTSDGGRTWAKVTWKGAA
jgi:photosystem II stability/assembly factor-like uncharacterized protein